MRILTVEDNREISAYLRNNLEEMSYAVDVAHDGVEGSLLIRDNDYDLIILDNILPQKSGKQLCQEVRALGRTTPIIMLSVKGETEDKVELLNAGADDYLTKPFAIDELLARMRALLRRPKTMKDEIMKVGDLILDVKKHTVRLGKEHIYLTRKEFGLLRYLMRNEGNILSRNMIMEHVWDMSADPFSNTIEAHITSLRKKLGKKGGGMIKTVPGRGYKIVAPEGTNKKKREE